MSDDIIWTVLNHQFCAFKLKTTKEQSFCRNEYNVSGLCTRQSCPLANARYATVKSDNGRLYLYMKTAERSHMPNKWWERIKLSSQYSKALEQIDEHLIYWPGFLKHKCKQRLTRLTQVAITERRMALKERERHYTSTAPKVKRREATRERKALAAAKLEKSIEKELLDRLKSGAYGEKPLNVDEKLWNKVLDNVSEEQQLENEDEAELEDELEDEELSEDGEVEYVEAEDEDDELVELEDLEKWLGDSDEEATNLSDSESSSDDDDNDRKAGTKSHKKSQDSKPKKRSRPRVEIEYEEENANGKDAIYNW